MAKERKPPKPPSFSVTGRYRNVHCMIWSDDKFPFISDDAQLVWFHAFTNQYTNSIGLYRASMEALAADKRWPLKRYREGFNECSSNGFVTIDERFHVVFFKRFLDWNKPSNPNTLAGWLKVFSEVPECESKAIWYQGVKLLTEPFGKGFHTILEEFEKGYRPGTVTGTVSGIGTETGSGVAPQIDIREFHSPQENDSTAPAQANPEDRGNRLPPEVTMPLEGGVAPAAQPAPAAPEPPVREVALPPSGNHREPPAKKRRNVNTYGERDPDKAELTLLDPPMDLLEWMKKRANDSRKGWHYGKKNSEKYDAKNQGPTPAMETALRDIETAWQPWRVRRWWMEFLASPDSNGKRYPYSEFLEHFVPSKQRPIADIDAKIEARKNYVDSIKKIDENPWAGDDPKNAEDRQLLLNGLARIDREIAELAGQ